MNVKRDILSVIDKLMEVGNFYKKDVNREMQRNDFLYIHLKELLKELGFIVKANIKQCSICRYGKSMLDMYFYKDSGKSVV